VNRPPVIRLVNDILFRALQMRQRCSCTPYETKLQIRYRVDGILYDVLSLNKNVLPLIISRIKLWRAWTSRSAACRRTGAPPSGWPAGSGPACQHRPDQLRERCVLRILDKSSGVYGLNELGLWPDDLKKLDSLLNRAHGVIFVTGPTGSGKSTSLYAYLNRINSAEKNVITIEDPIDTSSQGSARSSRQQEGHDLRDLPAARAASGPDVIMVGEVRDAEPPAWRFSLR